MPISQITEKELKNKNQNFSFNPPRIKSPLNNRNNQKSLTMQSASRNHNNDLENQRLLLEAIVSRVLNQTPNSKYPFYFKMRI